MTKLSTNLAIIPARAGSKGIRNKNLQQVGSKNLIEHAISSARQSNLLTDTIITSDHSEILSIGDFYKIHTRKRPSDMATDESPVVDCLQDAVSFIEDKTKKRFDNIILLQPTSPIRTGKDIDNVITMLDNDESLEGVISVCDCGVFLPDHQYKIITPTDSKNSILVPYVISTQSERLRRQEIDGSYIRNGAIYAARKSILMNNNKIIVDNKSPYIMPKKYLCNLDDPEDLELAKIIVPAWENNLI